MMRMELRMNNQKIIILMEKGKMLRAKKIIIKIKIKKKLNWTYINDYFF